MEFLILMLFFVCPIIMLALFLYGILKMASICSQIEEMEQGVLERKGDVK